jgi:hypothetical protein
VTSFPHLEQYLSRLPAGMASYPDCKSRGTLVLSSLVGHDLSPVLEDLPAPLGNLVRHPPLPGAWVPAVHSDAIFFAVADTFHPTADAVLAWTRERTLHTARSKMYRALTRMTGPRVALRMTATVHGMFQRGTNMSAESIDGGMMLRLEHPPYLHGGLNHVANVAMIEVLLEIAGGVTTSVEMLESGPRGAVYRARWNLQERT